MKSEREKVDWHTACKQVLKAELWDYRDKLEFLDEHKLTKEPLRIDCVTIKKPKDLVVNKNFAMFFRETNIIEYKSPNDYLSIKDFYKVYAYVCLYTSLERSSISEKTITFIIGRTPKKLIKYLEKKRKLIVEKTNTGIYTIKGDFYPMQIINNKELSKDENLWLSTLRDNLDAKTFIDINDEAYKRGLERQITAYLQLLALVNSDIIEEAMDMRYSQKRLDEVLDKIGLTAKAEARGEERRNREIAQNMKNQGFTIDQIISATRLSPEKVEALIEA